MSVDRNRATVRDVFRMFASMAHGATFGELCVRCNPAALNINEKQMVLFGLVEGLIRRVDRYPVTVSRNLFIDDNNNNSGGLNGIVNPAALIGQHHHHRVTRPLPRGERWNPRATRGCCGVGVAAFPPPSSSVTHQQQPPSRQFSHGVGESGHKQLPFHRIPAEQPPASPMATSPMAAKKQQQQQQPAHFYNGLKSLDEICCARGISCQQLEQQLARDRHVIVLLK